MGQPKEKSNLLKLISDTGASISEVERDQAIKWLASVDFSSDERPLRNWARALLLPAFVDTPHPSRPAEKLSPETSLNSIEYHLLKHRADWDPSTTVQEYESGMRDACQRASCLDVGRAVLKYPNGSQRHAPRAMTQTPSTITPPIPKLTPRPDRVLLVIADPERAKLISCYAASPDDAEEELAKWKPRRTFRR